MLVRDGLGHEDICVKLGIRCERGRQIVRKLVLCEELHVKHLQSVRREDAGTG
jgi:hypothetical protein